MEESGLCVLIAEDDPIIRGSVARALLKQGYCVLAAPDGLDALRLASEYDGRISVLITDINMPGMDGHELSRTLKKQRSDLLVLVVSADGEGDFPNDSLHDGWLKKPIDPAIVPASVAHILRRYERKLNP